MVSKKQIKEAKAGVFKTETPGLTLKIFQRNMAKGKLGPVERNWYLKYKISGVTKWPVIGAYVENSSEQSNSKFTIAGATLRAEEIKEAASKGINLLATDPVVTLAVDLKDKIKEFFEDILFTQNGHPGIKLKYMSDKNRLTYFPPRKVEKDKDNRKRKGKLIKGMKANQEEPRYSDQEMSQRDPIKYPEVDRQTYWGYLGSYNNWVAGSEIKHKPNKSSTGIKLININYNEIQIHYWKLLHQEVLNKSKSKYRANDTLAMLRVFYNWLIVRKDKYILENPITEALSLPKIGPRATRVDGVGTWAKIYKRDVKKNKEGLTPEQLNNLTNLLETELILEPKGPVDRLRNRSLLFMRLRLLTGCRPDVSEDLTWDMLRTRSTKIEVLSKGKIYPLNISYARAQIFDRMKELKSDEPGHPYVFSSEDKRGNPIGNKKVDKLWKTVRDLAAIPKDWDFYNLKHTAGTFIQEITGDVAYGADTLGITKEVFLNSYVIGNSVAENDKLMSAFWDKKLRKPKLVVNNK